MAESQIVKLEIPRSTLFVSIARKTVEEIASRMALTDEQTQDLKLAVGEACTNAVKFSIADSPAVHISYRIAPDMLEIEVRNKGNSFCPPEVCDVRPSIEKMAEGGLGIFLIRRLMDDLHIESKSGETTVTMVKRFGA